MRRIVKVLSEDQKTIQLTVADERWYIKYDDEQKNPVYYPSVTWIAGYYPKGIGFYKWLANTGWNEAEAIKNAAGDKGSKIHRAIEDLIDGKVVAMESSYINNTTEQLEALTLEEYECILSFSRWWNEVKPITVARDLTVFNEQEFYAGTMDYLCKIDNQQWLIDFKTSQNIWPEHELQISAYKHAQEKEVRLAILQLGYQRNKNKFKFTEINDKFDLFLAAKKIWQEEVGKVQPLQKDLPTFIQLQQNIK